MDGHRIRYFILLADVVVLTPHWHRLCVEFQERLKRDELDLFVDLKHNCHVGDAAILVGLACQGHKFRNLRLKKDVLPVLVSEVEFL